MTKDLAEALKQIKTQLPKPEKRVYSRVTINNEPKTFAQMVGAVTPLKSSNRYAHPIDKSPIKKRQQEFDIDIPIFYSADPLREAPAQHFKNGRGRQDIQKLLNHTYPIVGTLDLHGDTQEGLQERLSEFCFYVRSKGVCGQIIHGSGLGSQHSRPILKNIVRTWLTQNPDVLAYTEERNNDGAVLILLKKNRE